MVGYKIAELLMHQSCQRAEDVEPDPNPSPDLSASLSPIKTRNQKHHFKLRRSFNKNENEFYPSIYSHTIYKLIHATRCSLCFIHRKSLKTLLLTENLNFAGPIEFGPMEGQQFFKIQAWTPPGPDPKNARPIDNSVMHYSANLYAYYRTAISNIFGQYLGKK